jgi:hypothetical protein
VLAAAAVGLPDVVGAAPRTTDDGALEVSGAVVGCEAAGVALATATAIARDGGAPSTGGATATLELPSRPDAPSATAARTSAKPSTTTTRHPHRLSSAIRGAFQTDSGTAGRWPATAVPAAGSRF